MIASIRGRCLGLTAEGALVEVGGVGLSLCCTPAALALLTPGVECMLATALVIREDAWTLYGFANDAERGLFDLLQTVTGIGPRIAVAALGSLGAVGIQGAIAAGDSATLTTVPGVGKKGADRIVLELRDKVGPVPSPAAEPSTPSGWEAQVSDGLVSLGWQRRDAEAAVTRVAAEVLSDSLDTADVGFLLRRALSQLDRA